MERISGSCTALTMANLPGMSMWRLRGLGAALAGDSRGLAAAALPRFVEGRSSLDSMPLPLPPLLLPLLPLLPLQPPPFQGWVSIHCMLAVTWSSWDTAEEVEPDEVGPDEELEDESLSWRAARHTSMCSASKPRTKRFAWRAVLSAIGWRLRARQGLHLRHSTSLAHRLTAQTKGRNQRNVKKRNLSELYLQK